MIENLLNFMIEDLLNFMSEDLLNLMIERLLIEDQVDSRRTIAKQSQNNRKIITVELLNQ